MRRIRIHDLGPLGDTYHYAIVSGSFHAVTALRLGLANIRNEIQRGFVIQIVRFPSDAQPWIEQIFQTVESFDLWVATRFHLLFEA